MNKNKLPERLDSLIEAEKRWIIVEFGIYCILFSNKGKIPELHVFNSKKSRDLYVITSKDTETLYGYKFYQSITYKRNEINS